MFGLRRPTLGLWSADSGHRHGRSTATATACQGDPLRRPRAVSSPMSDRVQIRAGLVDARSVRTWFMTISFSHMAGVNFEDSSCNN